MVRFFIFKRIFLLILEYYPYIEKESGVLKCTKRIAELFKAL